MAQYWLMKSEPDVFSIDDLKRVGSTSWEGVRNYTARNFLRAMKQGDGVLFHHSQATPPGIAGLARVSREAENDPSALDPKSPYFDEGAPADRWSWVHIEHVATFPELLSLERLRGEKALAEMLLLKKGNRLSVTPVTAAEWKAICKLAGVKG